MKRQKTIRSHIFHGYAVTIALVIVMVAVTLLYLFFIQQEYHTVSMNRTNQVRTQEAVASHYQWLNSLNESLQSGTEFSGGLDHTKCSLGKWVADTDSESLRDTTIKTTLDAIMDPHEAIHGLASPLLELGKQDAEKAHQQYSQQVVPKVNQVIEGLTTISGQYMQIADSAAQRLEYLIGFSIITDVLLAVLMVLLSSRIGSSIAKKLSHPIAAVAEWSKELSDGVDNLDFGVLNAGASSIEEVEMMIESFQKMAQNVQENVRVVQRVADGDMTAFVNIRSSKDSLGKNIYRMVQSNDLLFSNILKIAHKVADGSDQIAQASHSLAKSADIQAEAVHGLSQTIDSAGGLIEDSAEKTRAATQISEHIRADAMESSERMARLVTAVDEIRDASEQVSAVIKSIDDIAFQTDILALNAAVEAARAGEAGKGFAVVANEVRQLALKSASAANQSKILIENTIQKTHDGGQISVEAQEVFEKIMEEIKEITGMVSSIAASSEEQMLGIDQVRQEITQISQAAAGNAAVSQQSAAASREMSGDAELLKKAISKFNLRKRQPGRAYIPPEKQNDLDFIRRANENYQRAMETGQYGFEYIKSDKAAG